MAIDIGGGITIGPGISMGSSGSGGTPGVDNVTGYSQMSNPIQTSFEDPTTTINGTTGFTINDSTKTGIAMSQLTASNQAWFQSNYPTTPSTHTCTWGPGSTVASSSINLVQNSGSTIVFFIQGQSGAATYNYPFTFS